jgi:glyoxylase-like metal-dependent hydrolase (beta-lactamase superfamily II)
MNDANDLRDGEPQLIDVLHLGNPRVIGAWRVGDVLIDPGPSSSIATLLPGLDAEPPRAIALTHIHLDHAGAAGTLAKRYPEADVWVHERGAPHLIDPAKLLASAGRLYGEHMERLWGEFLAVPAERIRVLRGGEQLGAFSVAYTPGHASHHVSYMHEPSGIAFTGDVAGVRIGSGAVIAPTPPPDIDLDAWRASLATIEAWQPRRLAVTHFGVHDEPAAHIAALREHLDEVEAWAGEGDEASFVARMRERVAGNAAYSHALPPEQSYQGLARYLSKRAALEHATAELRSGDV